MCPRAAEQKKATIQPESSRSRFRSYRVKRDFDEIDRSDFRQTAFAVIRDYFERTIVEIDAIEDLRGRFASLSASSFTCTIVNRAHVHGTAHITVHSCTDNTGFGDISYSFTENASPNTANGMFTIEADEYEFFLSPMMMMDERRQRAKQIADQLRDHSRWKTHGRSLKIDDLRQMKLYVTDYSSTPELADAIRRYYTLLQMTFATNIYKIFETPSSQIMRMEVVQSQKIFGSSAPIQAPAGSGSIEAQVACSKCGTSFVVQARVDPRAPAKSGAIQLPADNLIKCPGTGCSEVHNLTTLRSQIESATGKRVLAP